MKPGFWIDRGGTFTDVIARAPDGGETPAEAALGLARLRRRRGGGPCAGMLGVARRAPLPGRARRGHQDGHHRGHQRPAGAQGRQDPVRHHRGLRRRPDHRRPVPPELFALDIVRPAAALRRRGRGRRAAGRRGAVVCAAGRARRWPRWRTRVAERASTSAAIAFLHADLNPGPRARGRADREAAGFAFVALSHEVSPLPRFIPRAETTVADAYLTPVLRAYVEQVAGAVAGAPLYFMTSAGGLVRAEAFRGRDAVVSGPAGGVVGVARTARRRRRGAGARLRHGRHLHRRLPLRRRAGAPRHRPGGRRQAARADAGRGDRGGRRRLDPGLRRPARPGRPGQRRRRSRPGRLRPRRPGHRHRRQPGAGPARPALLPRRVRPGGDRAAGRRRRPRAPRRAGRRHGRAERREAAAEGFVAVAVEQTAQAIRRISTERGFDPRGHALVAFGGAAGQVACQVAEALGVTEVLCPATPACSRPGASARRGCAACARPAWSAPLDADGPAARRCPGRLEARRRPTWPTRARAPAAIEPRLRLRYDGADAALPVAVGAARRSKAAFEAAHQRLFGFIEPARPILIASVEVEAGRRSPRAGSPRAPRARLAPARAPRSRRLAGSGTATPGAASCRRAWPPVDGPPSSSAPTPRSRWRPAGAPRRTPTA